MKLQKGHDTVMASSQIFVKFSSVMFNIALYIEIYNLFAYNFYLF